MFKLYLLSRLNELTFSIRILECCDPDVALKSYTHLMYNYMMLRWLWDKYGKELEIQVYTNITTVSYLLFGTMRACLTDCKFLLSCLQEYNISKNRDEYFMKTLVKPSCVFHKHATLLIGNVVLEKEICTLNDVENILKQINFCYSFIETESFTEIFHILDQFMQVSFMRGPVVPCELYEETTPCYVCFEELCLTANQGESIAFRLSKCLCNHITQTVKVNASIGEVCRCFPNLKLSSFHDAYREDIEADKDLDSSLNSACVFDEPTDTSFAASEQKFWTSIGTVQKKKQLKHNLQTLSKTCAAIKKEQNSVELNKFKRISKHFFFEQSNFKDDIKVLFTGTGIVAPDEQLEAVLETCLLHTVDLDNTGDKQALVDIVEDTAASSNNMPLEWITTDSNNVTENRQTMFKKKLAMHNFLRLRQCIDDKKHLLEKKLNVNVYGPALSHILVQLAATFQKRNNFINKALSVGTWSNFSLNEHLFIRNAVLSKSITVDDLSDLTNDFFRLLNGPCFSFQYHAFPCSLNTTLYYSVENVGLLPHYRAQLAYYISDVSDKPSAWMTSKFNEFYNFSTCSTVSEVQDKCWQYLREAVLAFYLVSKSFYLGDITHLMRTDGDDKPVDGVYLTHSKKIPVVVVFDNGNTFILCKDIYIALYEIVNARSN